MSKEAIIPISKNYVNYWNVGAGLREFRANARDGSSCEEDYGHNYDEETQTLRVWNKAEQKLSTSMLVLGLSSKESGDNSIGHFGEGAKVGFCVLAREGVEIECNNMDEHWLVEFKFNKGYNAEIMHVAITEKEPSDIIEFVFKKVTREHMNQFENYLLECHIESLERTMNGKKLIATETSVGTVYLDAPASTFVGGIRIQNADIGYMVNLKPSEVSLARDRDTIQWQRANDIAKIITAETITVDSAKGLTAYRKTQTLQRMLSVLSEMETSDDVYEGEFVDRYKEIIEILARNEIKLFDEKDPSTLVVDSESDKEKAEHLGIDVVVIGVSERKALSILGRKVEDCMWVQEDYEPMKLMAKVQKSFNTYYQHKTDANLENLETALKLAVLSSKNWQQW